MTTSIWLLSWLSIQPRTSPLKFDHFVVKSEKGSISDLSTKARAPLARVLAYLDANEDLAYLHNIERAAEIPLDSKLPVALGWGRCYIMYHLFNDTTFFEMSNYLFKKMLQKCRMSD